MAVALTVGLGVGMVGTASAQIPVTDAMAISNQTEEYTTEYATMLSQLTQLESMLATATQQLSSSTGNRGLGSLLPESYANNNTSTWQSAINGGSDSIASLANSIEQEASQLNSGSFNNVDPIVVAALAYGMSTESTGQAENAMQYQSAQNRYIRLQEMMGQINLTSDPKSIAELQARLEAENSMMLNQLLQLQSQNSMRENARKMRDEKQRQSNFQSLITKY
ncbi:type IV secretion system protein [Dyella sp. M7H15-1]|uniref:type IV secretion system protein n=1 Tax=Dyella sp. M7H15-1 TaxID=2501295 RepID=UPI0013E8E37A|nr:type IV secretion system protein [Dyella sp. M7H15-1]